MAGNAAPALKSLAWGTYGCRQGRRLYLWVEQGLFDGVEVRGRDDTLIGVTGLFVRNRKKSRRVIEVAGFLRGVGATDVARALDYETLRAEVESEFSYVARRNLVAVLLNDDVYTISALPLNILVDELRVDLAKVSIELESVAPDWTVT